MVLRIFLIFLVCWGQVAQGELCLDLEMAWERVVKATPSLAAKEMEVYIQEANKRQVSLLPNPVAIVEADNIGVSHPNEDTDPPQSTYGISQLIELGGKRAARRSLAEATKGVAYWDAQVARQDLRLSLATAFIDVSAAQERVRLAQQKQELAENMVKAVGAQVAGGKVSPLKEKKSFLCLKLAQVEVTEAMSELNEAKNRLAFLWGSGCQDFDCVCFDLYESLPLPSIESCVEGLYATPDFALIRQNVFSAGRNRLLQKANSVPDIDFMVGYRYFHDAHRHGWVVGAEIPLPIFDRNQGNIQRAGFEITQAQFQLEQFVRDTTEEITALYVKMCASFEEGELLRSGVLAEACEAFTLTEVGYQNGKIDYIELLEALKTVYEIKEKYIEILNDYHINRSELERLSGQYNCI